METDFVNDSATAAPHPGGPVDDMMVDGMQVLQTGFALARASQLTMLRLQLALHGSKPHAAMQALDILLDIDVEMESIAARLVGNSLHLAENVALSDFMRFQKTAIATEKHAMTGEYGRSQAGLVTIPSPCTAAGGVDPSGQSLASDDEVENGQRATYLRWIPILVVAMVVTILGIGLIAY
jgi:hypothetical protein